jgi:hypothetical protein
MQTLVNILDFIVSHEVLFAFALSVLAVLTGKLIFNISPLQRLEEIAYKQRVYRRKAEQETYKKKITEYHLELGNTFLDLRQVAAAKIEFQTVLKLDPINKEAQRGLFKSEIFEPIQEEHYDPEIVKRRLDMVLKDDPSDNMLYYF